MMWGAGQSPGETIVGHRRRAIMCENLVASPTKPLHPHPRRMKQKRRCTPSELNALCSFIAPVIQFFAKVAWSDPRHRRQVQRLLPRLLPSRMEAGAPRVRRAKPSRPADRRGEG